MPAGGYAVKIKLHFTFRKVLKETLPKLIQLALNQLLPEQ